MQIGLSVALFDNPAGAAGIAPALGRTARAAEAAGFSSLWVMDHFFQIPGVGDVEQPMLEGYSALAYAAALTERIRLGTLVTGVTYRHPGILVKTVTTLDVLSGGRAWLGIGAGWFEREHLGLGVPFPPTAERFARLEETLRIAKQMWEGDASPFAGTHYQLAEPIGSPLPLSRPHPPIMVGGGGEKKTLRLVAKYADACNLFAAGGADEVRHKLDVLRAHCEAEGRDYDAIEKTTIGWAVMREPGPGAIGVDEAVRLLDRLRALGVQHHIFGAPVVAADAGMIDLVASEVMPRVG
jgi:F420-dependent oxidoreductase-like protein